MSTVKVTANDKGQVVIPSVNNPEFGYIRVEQTSSSMEGGWLRKSTKSALIRGKVADLNDLGYTAGKSIAGKIIIKESHVAAFEGQDCKINPTTKAPVLSGGQKVYRDAFYTSDLNAQDVLLASDTVAVSAPAMKLNA